MEKVDRRSQVDVIYTDFTSAFDKVDHYLLLLKLKRYGICAEMWLWFLSYLTARPQNVVINGFSSETYYSTSGVPQGSHLGPKLFLIFINDIVDYLPNSHSSLFADDLKLYREILSNNDVSLLQSDLNALSLWCRRNRMHLNPTKCFHIKFTRKKNPIASSYQIEFVELDEVNEIRDLGIILDSKLNFISHMNNIISNSAKMIGFIRRNTKEFQSISTKVTLYKSLARSTLEFGSVVWNPSYAVHSQRIESIQRAFTRHLAWKSPSISARASYQDRLKHFKLDPLHKRRKIYDLTFLHKLTHGRTSDKTLLEKLKFTVPRLPIRKKVQNTFYIPNYLTNLGRHSPIARMCSTYNHISNNIDIFSNSLQQFKSKLLKFM